jgi:hypothetical protein
MLAKWKARYNGTIVLGLANKIQKERELRGERELEIRGLSG